MKKKSITIGGFLIALLTVLANFSTVTEFITGKKLPGLTNSERESKSRTTVQRRTSRNINATGKTKTNRKTIGTGSRKTPIHSGTTLNTEGITYTAESQEKRTIREFTLTVSNIIGFPRSAYTLKDRLLGLPGVQDVRLSESSFQTDTKSAKFFIQFSGGDNRQLIRLIHNKIPLFTFDKQVKYRGEREIKMWVAY